MGRANPEIVIEGLADVQRTLRSVDKALPRELRRISKQVADLARDAAREQAPRGESGRLANSIASRPEQRGAAVKGGGARVPYFGFIDFGNEVGTGGGVGRGDSHPRPFIKGGRILYPALAANYDRIVDNYARALNSLLRDAGLQ